MGFWGKRKQTMAISPVAYDEIAEKIGAADLGALDMSNMILVRGPEPAPQPLAGHKPLSTVTQKVKRANRG